MMVPKTDGAKSHYYSKDKKMITWSNDTGKERMNEILLYLICC